ncbi:MAG: protein kinase [Polyangiaceae bacterium]|nr:protein kinase [Polyangiaceae bacterium]
MADDVFGIVGTTQAGNFHVEQVVAEGGFGVVYRALHGGFRAPVALKCLKVSEARTSRERDLFLEKFREEAELLFRLSASIPEVVRPLHVDVLHLKDGQFVPFLALEWLEGESLDKLIDRRREEGEPPMGLQKMLKLFRPIAHAIARAHRFPSPTGTVSIIHRDLKPENIFITMQDGAERPRILDFGIAQARSLAEQAVGRATSGDKLNAFSPAYAAPEQWVPKRYGQAGPWTDVWGLAITMVEALVGRQVIEGEPQAMMGTALDTSRRPTPRAEGINIPPAVDAVFERALAVNPRDRTKDIETFWTELEAAMGFAPSFGARAADDPYGPASGPPASHATPPAFAAIPPPPPASVSPRSVKQRMGDLWLETPESAPLELDLDAAPASLRSAVLSQRGGPLSVRPLAPEIGEELELPSADTPPPPARIRAPVPVAGPLSARGRELSTPPPLHAELASDPRTGPASAPPASRPSMPPVCRPPASMRPASTAPVAAPLPAGARPQHRPPIAPPPAEPPSMFQRAGIPLLIVALAAALLATDLLMRISGDGLSFGPLRSVWLAGLLFVVGAGMFFWRMLGDSNDG